jgi:DNA-binding transcriptional MerR regulator
MRIGELSRRSGVPVPTIKYYLREGLLPLGTLTAANQAEYGDEHVKRLRLVRALLEVGGLSVAATADVVAHLDEPSSHELLGRAHHAISPAPRGSRDSDHWRQAREAAAALVARRGWRVEESAPALDWLADVLAALDALDQPHFVAAVDDYAAIAERLAAIDLDLVAGRGLDQPAALVEAVVVGTLLGEAMFNAIRRLAQEDASARRFAGPGQG